MKKLVFGSDWFGPFNQVVAKPDAYVGDGCVFPIATFGVGAIKDYDPAVDTRPIPDDVIEAQWDAVRQERNNILSSCDWTQLPDAPLTNVQTADWAVYRQALRDITAQPDPFSVNWPTAPGAA